VAGLLAFFSVVSRLIDLAIRLGDQMQSNRFDQWVEELDASVKQLEAAKSPEEKRNAALSISRVIARKR